MEIKEVKDNKKQFLSLLLLADEQENMIDKYIDRGIMYVLDDEGIIKAECIITDEQNGVLEIKNLAVKPEYQRKGYGKVMIDFIIKNYKEKYSILQVGTGDSILTIPFYEQCGFIRSHYIKNFFIDNYEQPIYEDGIQLIDMIYLQRKLK
jgi:ribosomal protein S18 acetylase RimI-like enzyme